MKFRVSSFEFRMDEIPYSVFRVAQPGSPGATAQIPIFNFQFSIFISQSPF